jgi:diaminohydroxyphosphoribosylaminopyrimidine deaminase/5-amino-6-(5-phosphoribosylamino)uracil reductase
MALHPQDKLDRRFMRRALCLARRGLGASSPNPAVGAVVVQDGRAVGEGYHSQAGGPHAEVHALAAAGAEARGATLYATLEPCHHAGRTPPCTAAVLEAGVGRVVYGAADPNPRVAGGGGAFLAAQGVEVTPGVLAAECEHEHRFFLKHVATGLPWVALKTAATADGRTAAHGGDSRWVTGESARRHVHRLRSWLDAICVGSGTALADDPRLTCRLKNGRDPLRVIVDTRLRLPVTARAIAGPSPAHCLVVCGPRPPAEARAALEHAGARVMPLPPGPGGVDLAILCSELGRLGTTSLLLEGGARLAWGFLRAGLIDEVMYFFAPKLIGGQEAPGMIGGQGFARMADAVRLGPARVRRFGDDVMLQARVLGRGGGGGES